MPGRHKSNENKLIRQSVGSLFNYEKTSFMEKKKPSLGERNEANMLMFIMCKRSTERMIFLVDGDQEEDLVFVFI